MPTTTFHSATGSNDPVDGGMEFDGADGTWASTHDAASSGNNSDSSTDVFIQRYDFAGGQYNLRRTAFIFDTSSIPAGSTINSATFSVFGTNTTHLTNGDSINIYSVTLASNSTCAATDYNKSNWGTTAYCNSAIVDTAWNVSGYNDFAFNATGLAAVNMGTGARTKIGMRAVGDVNNVAPTGRSIVNGLMADNGTNIPKLVVTYTLPVLTMQVFMATQPDIRSVDSIIMF